MSVDMERYRCPDCGGFDFDDDGCPQPCMGGPKEEPIDWEDHGGDPE